MVKWSKSVKTKSSLKGPRKLYTCIKHYWYMFKLYNMKLNIRLHELWFKLSKWDKKGKNGKNGYKAFIKYT